LLRAYAELTLAARSRRCRSNRGVLASADADYVVAQKLNVDRGNWMS
jgi:hypothetical protein